MKGFAHNEDLVQKVVLEKVRLVNWFKIIVVQGGKVSVFQSDNFAKAKYGWMQTVADPRISRRATSSTV